VAIPAASVQREPTQRHGPHLYLTYRSEAKNRALYVPAEHAEEVRRAQAAWKEFWEVACAMAAANREQLRHSMKRPRATTRRRRADG